MVLTENIQREISYLSVSRVPQSMMERDRRVDSHTCRSLSSPISRLPLITIKGQCLQAVKIYLSFTKFEDQEACSTEQVLASACQNSLYLQYKFWLTLASTRSPEHTSGLWKRYLWITFLDTWWNSGRHHLLLFAFGLVVKDLSLGSRYRVITKNHSFLVYVSTFWFSNSFIILKTYFSRSNVLHWCTNWTNWSRTESQQNISSKLYLNHFNQCPF